MQEREQELERAIETGAAQSGISVEEMRAQVEQLQRAGSGPGRTPMRDKIAAGLRAMFALNAVAQSTPRALRARQGGTTAPLAQRTAKRRAKNKAARKARKRNR